MARLDDKALSELKEMIGEEDFPEVFADLVQTYLNDSPTLMQGLITGAQEKSLKQIKINAHSLKSSSATLGAVEFSQLCQQIELSCIQENLDEACSLIPQLENEYQKIELLLNEELAKL